MDDVGDHWALEHKRTSRRWGFKVQKANDGKFVGRSTQAKYVHISKSWSRVLSKVPLSKIDCSLPEFGREND